MSRTILNKAETEAVRSCEVQILAPANLKENDMGIMTREDVSIKNIGLSVRSTGALLRNGVETVGELMDLTEEDLYAIRNLGVKSVNEILEAVDRLKNPELNPGELEAEETKPLTFRELIRTPEYRNSVLEFVRGNDKDLEAIGLSPRSWHRLALDYGKKMSDIIFLTYDEILSLRGLGVNSATEISKAIDDYLNEYEDRIRAYCDGDHAAIIDNKNVRRIILDLFNEAGTAALSLQDIRTRMSPTIKVPAYKTKCILDKLAREGKLNCKNYRYTRIYPNFDDVFNDTPGISDRNRAFIEYRLDGKTLKEISGKWGITREGVRQIVTRELKKVFAYNRKTNGTNHFAEDSYAYFYSTYDFDKSISEEWLGIPLHTLTYLEMIDTEKGDRPLSEAATDLKLSKDLRARIERYLNRNNLLLDGEWVNRSRLELEEFVIKKFCSDSMPFKDFVNTYNAFLEKEGVLFDPGLYITEEVYMTRKNRIADSRCVLWTQNETIRYYDIDGRDYTKLLDELNLESYKNVTISTAKLMWANPDIMEEYDIRDQYELHNLLRKIIPEGTLNDFHCERMPNIRFGEFDRDSAIIEIIIDNSPIKISDLLDILHERFGYDKATIRGSYLPGLKTFLHDGYYSI